MLEAWCQGALALRHSLIQIHSVHRQNELITNCIRRSAAHHHTAEEDFEVLHYARITRINIENELHRLGAFRQFHPTLLHGVVHAVVDVKGLHDRVLNSAEMHIAFVGDYDGGRHRADGNASEFLVIPNCPKDWRDLLAAHSHLSKQNEGNVGSCHRVIDAVDHIADIVKVSRDLAKLNIARRMAGVLKN